jgi:hypothetical protein
MRIDGATLDTTNTHVKADCDGMEVQQPDGRVWLSPEDLLELNVIARALQWEGFCD